MIPSSLRFDEAIKRLDRGRTKIKIVHGIKDNNKIFILGTTNAETPTLSATANMIINKPKYNFIRLSNNYFRTDGRQTIAPSQPTKEQLDTCGFTFKDKSDNKGNINIPYQVVLVKPNVDMKPKTIFGFIVNFDNFSNTYATDILVEIRDVKGVTFATREFTNDSTTFMFDEEFENVGSIIFTIRKINKPNALLRFTYFGLGVQKIYENQDLMQNAFHYKRSIDLLSNELSFSELSFNVDNRDMAYNPFNLQGIFKRFDKNQPITLYLGVEHNKNDVEYLEVANLFTQDFEFHDTYYTVKCVDLLSLLEKINYYTFSYEIYNSRDYDYADMVERIALDADGIVKKSDFITTPKMRETINRTMIPNVPFSEEVQLIANICNHVVFTNRKGLIEFKDAWIPKVTFEDNGHMEYSSVANAYNTNQLPEYTYIQLLKDFELTKPNSFQVIRKPDEYLGFVGNKISKADGTFDVNPIITINYSLPTTVESFYIVFDHLMQEYAQEFDVTYYSNERVVHELKYSNNTLFEISEDLALQGVTKYVIEIKKWSKANRRAVINRIGAGLIDDYYLDFHQMTQKPSIEMLGYVKNINCEFTKYTRESDVYQEIATQTFYGDKDGSGYYGEDRFHQFLCDEAHDGYIVEKVSGTGEITNIYGGASYNCSFTTSGNTDGMVVRLKGHKQKEDTFSVIKTYNDKGTTYSLSNPLCDTEEKAKKMIDWYYDYAEKGQTLSIDYRGDCRLEPFDFIYVESQYQKRVPVVITSVELDYNGGLKGKLEVLNV